MLIIFEEVGEMQLVIPLLLLVLPIVADVDSASPPLALTAVPDAHLHAIIIKASALCKTIDCELGLAFYSLHGEVKPRVSSHGIALQI